MTIAGSCHCGGVRITVPNLPDSVTRCLCSICRKLGMLWAYYPVAPVTVSGGTDTYMWNKRIIAFHRCSGCGCITHWQTLGRDFGRMGINARLLDGIDLAAITEIVLPGPAGPAIGPGC